LDVQAFVHWLRSQTWFFPQSAESKHPTQCPSNPQTPPWQSVLVTQTTQRPSVVLQSGPPSPAGVPLQSVDDRHPTHWWLAGLQTAVFPGWQGWVGQLSEKLQKPSGEQICPFWQSLVCAHSLHAPRTQKWELADGQSALVTQTTQPSFESHFGVATSQCPHAPRPAPVVLIPVVLVVVVLVPVVPVLPPVPVPLLWHPSEPAAATRTHPVKVNARGIEVIVPSSERQLGRRKHWRRTEGWRSGTCSGRYSTNHSKPVRNRRPKSVLGRAMGCSRVVGSDRHEDDSDHEGRSGSRPANKARAVSEKAKSFLLRI
jgi:hypothetical protein